MLRRGMRPQTSSSRLAWEAVPDFFLEETMGKRGRILGGFLLAALLFTLLGCVGLAAAQKAQLNNMPVLVYDEAIGVEAYNINDNNYFKLRDVAQALSGGDKSFEIQYLSLIHI